MPATIVSRCQRFDFRRIGVPDIVGALQGIAEAEGIEVETEALAAIARAADGGMRDSQSILDQLVAYGGSSIDVQTVNDVLGVTDLQTLIQIVGAILASDHARICGIVDQLISQGKDLGQLLDDLMLYARDLARVSLQCEPIGPVAGSPDDPSIIQQSQALASERAMALMTHFAKVRQEFRRSTQHGLLLETALLEATVPATTAAPQPAPQPVVGQPIQPTAPVQAPPTEIPARPTPTPTPVQPRAETPAPPPAQPAATPPAPEPAPAPAPTAPEPEPQPAPAAGGLSLETVLANWGQVAGVLRGMRHMPIVAVLQEGRPTAVDGNRITITFSTRHKFHHGQVDGKHRELIQQAASQALGCPVEIEAALSDEAPAPEVKPHAELGLPPEPGLVAPGEDNPALRDVQDVFPGSRISKDGQPG